MNTAECNLSSLLNELQLLRADNQNIGEEEMLEMILRDFERRDIPALSIKSPVLHDDDFTRKVFRGIITSSNTRHLIIRQTATPSLASFINRSLPEPIEIESLSFLNVMSSLKADVEQLLATLNEKIHVQKVALLTWDNEQENGAGSAFSQYLQRSTSLNQVILYFQCNQSGLSESFLTSIFNGIGASASLTKVSIISSSFGVVDGDTNRVTKCLVDAVVASSCIQKIILVNPIADCPFAFDRIQSELNRSRAFQESELTYTCKSVGTDYKMLSLIRKCWWKDVLPLDIPLALWPRVLAKSGHQSRGNDTISHAHTPTDIMYFFVKEKCDTLFQCVRDAPNKKKNAVLKQAQLSGQKRRRDC